MESRLIDALKLKYSPVAIVWTDQKPENAQQFQPGKWGCVMGAFGAVAERGRPAVFDAQTYGCWGGGVGLGFGNAYHQFPGGMPGFCRFLSDGNEKHPEGKAVADACSAWMRGDFLDDFLHGERYRKNPELVKLMVDNMPITQVPAKYVMFKPFAQLAAAEIPQVIVVLADPDQLAALVVLANYGRGTNENAIIPFVAGCQAIGITAYRENQSDRPRAVVGQMDLSARKYLRRLGKDLVTVALPYKLFREMEENLSGSFLEGHLWKQLQET